MPFTVLSLIFVLSFFFHRGNGQIPAYGQCGGNGYTGSTQCITGTVCIILNALAGYSECLPVSGGQLTPTMTCTSRNINTATTSCATTSTITIHPASSLSTYPLYSKRSLPPSMSTVTSCHSSGPTWVATCFYTLTGTYITSASTPTPTSTTVTISIFPTPTECTVIADPPSPTSIQFRGMSIAGLEQMCDNDGRYNLDDGVIPLSQYGGTNGAGEMSHFVSVEHHNIFRLPVCWQFLTGGSPTSNLNSVNFGEYDALVQACLNTGSYCIIDLHNNGWFEGQPIAEASSPTSIQFINLWYAVAAKYSSNDHVMFGLINYIHDSPDIYIWAAIAQGAVNAIRLAGATQQTILLSGTNYTYADSFLDSGSSYALNYIQDPSGDGSKLIFDVHQYLDSSTGSDATHTSPVCVTDGINNSLDQLALWLRCMGRQALVTEAGGWDVSTCFTYTCRMTQFLKENSDVFIGYIGWAAGNYPSQPVVENLAPSQMSGAWTDNPIVSSCL